MVEGARRIGKSTICQEFARNEYDSYDNVFVRTNKIALAGRYNIEED